MNFLKKIMLLFKQKTCIKPNKIGIVGYPSIGKTVYLTTFYGISCVLRQTKKLKVVAGKSQQYFQHKWNQITGVERQFLAKQVEQTQFEFQITPVSSCTIY